MILTEKEAKTKWCPMLRIGPARENWTCLASDCAMWRWGDRIFDHANRRWIGRGYCGLAGAAEGIKDD
jgi:hypothetical protein